MAERRVGIFCFLNNFSSSKSTRSPAACCFCNDVSVWVAPAFIKSKGWGNPDRNVVAKKQHAAGERVDLLDDYDFPARTITETVNNFCFVFTRSHDFNNIFRRETKRTKVQPHEKLHFKYWFCMPLSNPSWAKNIPKISPNHINDT